MKFINVGYGNTCINFDNNVNTALGVRPVVSLKLGTSIEDGDGTSGSPYIIK